MKRFHVNVDVADLERSIEFYNTLFATEPTVTKPDYAKWMLEDPRINFSISLSSRSTGIHHVGLQTDTLEELGEIQGRLRKAEQQTFDQDDVECCYARSTKTWVRDPQGVAWETFVTHGSSTQFGDGVPLDAASEATTESLCCA